MRQAELGLLGSSRPDDLTNGEFGRFSEEKRSIIDLSKVQWLVMNDLMKAAEDLYKEVKGARELRGAAAPGLVEKGRRGRRRPDERLRARDPW